MDTVTLGMFAAFLGYGFFVLYWAWKAPGDGRTARKISRALLLLSATCAIASAVWLAMKSLSNIGAFGLLVGAIWLALGAGFIHIRTRSQRSLA